MKRLAVLTSGGDAPGMNAAIRAIVRASVYYNAEIYGVYRGYKGLMQGELVHMDAASVGDIVHKGGTILKSARSKAFKTEEGRSKAVEQLNAFGIDGLVVIGGDGSFMGAEKLNELGFPTIALPGTIDNDLNYTDYSIGFDTAVNTVLEAVTKIRDTSTSHEKATIIEVMGRNCGDIALHAGVSGGAESIIIPEEPVDTAEVIAKLRKGQKQGKEHQIIMLAEGANQAQLLQNELLERAEVNARVSVLGFIQRGGDPTGRDRILASKMGVRAVEMLLNGVSNHAVGIRHDKLYEIPIADALKEEKQLDEEMYKLTQILSI
ncbi:6-phosphofructokinase [Salisediminibacterium halotolerans]|uniref:6-phosphofructokinase n=1 Tax=Salisediminibacterium halotolerans TaxID=517425 RepID=UPI000EAF3C6B|nr:6-phosphofructokinase [Salisediminibacterium halotolerans]RLJ73200.1 6-phosphofructokinase [Actinophytocola xinjiangensis]RPE86622.1 6-phosphofructokinase [Salisediminibacterium halotolerans]TWG33997.1 6-phosphofructokinase [Salisediminibacterium halotolerans]GEL06596.1 ATP-dependent 6-phosphofructokinase [Salisediminibacterium halotolerans]